MKHSPNFAASPRPLMSEPCGMWPNWPSEKPCGKVASLAIPAEDGKTPTTPICDECIARYGAGHKFLVRIAASAITGEPK